MSRVRDNTRVVPFAWEAKETNLRDGVISWPESRLVPCVQADWMSDVVTKRFEVLSKLGSVILNPMERIRSNVAMLPVDIWKQRSDDNVPPNVYRYTTNGNSYGIDFNVRTHPPTLEAISRSEALAITDAYAEVGSPDVATLTELAEGKETIQFLMSPVKKMVTITRHFRKKLRSHEGALASHAKSVARWKSLPPRVRSKRPKPVTPKFPKFEYKGISVSDIASYWLAYRYAIMPLVYTVQDIQSLLKKQLVEQPLRVTARGKAKSNVSINVLTDEAYYASRNGYTYERYHFVGNISIVSRAGVLYVPEIGLQTQLGIRLNRVPAAMYEAIPLSFVTDWFHNGSNYYDALTAEFRAQKILGAWVTTTVKYDGHVVFMMRPGDSRTSTFGSAQTCLFSGTWQTRKPASLLDVRLALRVEMNAKRVADGLALIYLFLATAKKT